MRALKERSAARLAEAAREAAASWPPARTAAARTLAPRAVRAASRGFLGERVHEVRDEEARRGDDGEG